MCARKSKAKKFSHQDCATCHQSDGSNNEHFSQNGVSKTNLPNGNPPPNECTPTVIMCPKIVKVTDKDVEVGERASINRDRRRSVQYNFKEDDQIEDSEELRRKAFQLYKKYLEQKQGSPRLPPNLCPTEPIKCHPDRFYDDGSDDGCYDPSFNIFLVIVFMILLVMLLITSGFIYVVIKTDWLRDIFREYALYFIVPALFIVFIMNCTMACSPCSRVLPCNFLYLLFAVACMSAILSVITVLLDTSLVLLIYATTAVVIAFFIMLAYSPFDFTKWILYVIAIILALMAIWGLLVAGRKYLHVTYGPAQLFLAITCSVMNVVILVIELQLLLSGRSIDLDESEYATGAYLLYTAVLEMCFNLVQATGVLEEEKDEGNATCITAENVKRSLTDARMLASSTESPDLKPIV